MKKITFIIICSVISVFSFGQSKINFSSDPIFKETIQKQEELSNILISSLGKNTETYILIKNEIEEYQKQIGGDKSISNEMIIEKLSSILKLNSSINLNDYFNTITTNVKLLKTQYGNDFNEENIKASLLPNNESSKLTPMQAYTACTTVAYTTAALAYGGCVGTLFGAPLCFGLVAIGQTAAIAICAHEYLP